MKKPILTFLSDIYGIKLRKGIPKLQYDHFLDVLNHSKIDDMSDGERRSILFKVSLLHDILEDTKLSKEELYNLINIDKREMEILVLLSRIHNPSDKYISNIIEDEDALIVKLSDRISNMNDLIDWIDLRGLNKRNKKQSLNYLKENSNLIKLAKSKYKSILQSSADIVHPFKYQLKELENLNKKLAEIIKSKQTESVDLTESPVDNPETLTDRDIKEAFQSIIRLWKKSNSLKETYPKFIPRITKTMNYINELRKERGIKYIRELVGKIKFDEDDFLTQNMAEIKDNIIDSLKLLANRSTIVPKEGIKYELKDELHVSKAKVDDMIDSTDPKVLKKVYDGIIHIYERDFDDITKRLDKLSGNADFKYRATKFKELDRVIIKYIKKKKKDSKIDFLDLDDVLGYRAAFDSVDEMFEYMINVLKKDYAYRIQRYVGTTQAYQGVNAKINYAGRINYELQTVVDISQVVTDIQHDILYKSLIKINKNTKDKVLLLIKLALGIIFHQMRK